MMSLSIAMIVKNEEKNLPRCLSSVQGLAEEIIVVDTGSTDRTVAIAREFGAKVFHFDWVDDFAAARNASIAHCRGDWVLALDADEAIDPTDHGVIRSALNEDGNQAFRICMRNYLRSSGHTILDVLPVRNTSAYSIGSEFTHYVDYVINARIFRRFPDVSFSGRVHEVVDPYFESRGLAVGVTPAILHHFGKLDEQRQTYKKDFYLRLCEKDAVENLNDFRALFNLMMQYRAAGKWESCLKAAEAFTRVQKNVPATVFLTAATCHRNLGDLDDALHWIEKALLLEPAHAGALADKGACLILQDKLSEACVFLQRSIEIQPGYIVPHLLLSDVELRLGFPEAARGTLLRAIQANPTEEGLYTKLIQLSSSRGHLQSAGEDAALALAALPNGGSGLWHRFMAVSQLEAGAREPALRTVELGLRAFPSDAGLERLRAMCLPAL